MSGNKVPERQNTVPDCENVVPARENEPVSVPPAVAGGPASLSTRPLPQAVLTEGALLS